MTELAKPCRGHGGYPYIYTRRYVKIYETKCKLLGRRIGVCTKGMT